jgi:alkylated DNA repair dioxygenase AlkB
VTDQELSPQVTAACGVEVSPPNSCNLNYYPPGGGVGFHADDEPLFGGKLKIYRAYVRAYGGAYL